MHVRTLRASLVLVVFFSQFSYGLASKRQQQVGLEAILAELETHYGMAKYKDLTYGVTLDKLRAKYSRLIERAQTLEEDLGLDPAVPRDLLPTEEFRQLMIGMVAELRDGHVNLSRPDSRFGTLGFNAASIGEKLYVTEVRPDLLAANAAAQPLEAGDEVVAVDGIPVTELAKRNLLYAAGGTFEDRWQTAMSTVINNPHGFMRAKEEGERARVTFKKKGAEYVASLRWKDTSDYVFLTRLFPKNFPARGKIFSEDLAASYGMRGTVRSYFKSGLLANASLKETVIDIGDILNRDIKRAKDDEAGADKSLKEFEPVTRLSLYLIRYKDKNVAVFRLPNFSPPGGVADWKKEFLWLARGLKRLEKLSDVLVIDQLSNTGGSVYYATRLLSLFALRNQPMRTMTADLKLNETYLESLKPAYSTDAVTGNAPVHADLKLYQRFYDELKAKFESGEEWSGMMPALDLQTESLGDEPGEIFPAAEGAYSKPVLLMSDKMSGSMGDSFTAILQHNGRAKLFGETSCGLGGSLYRNTGSMPGSQMTMRCTSTYQELPDGWPLEGIGTVPDLYRDVRFSDLEDGFKRYATDALDEAVKLAAPGAGSEPATKIKGEATATAKPADPPSGKRARIVRGLKLLRTKADYISAAATLQKLAVGSETADWKGLIVPLPAPLLEDLILKTLWQRLEVLYRLREMRGLPVWENHTALIDAAIALAEALPPDTRFANPCELRLRMKPLR